MFEQAVNTFSSNPKQLFLIDGLGALLSVFLLGFVLVQLESFFGIPRNTLYFLAFLPCLFAVYDFFCFQKQTKRVGTFLKGIAFANIAYCLLSIGLAIYHYEKITYWGWSYIILEILIVLSVAGIEIQTANQLEIEA